VFRRDAIRALGRRLAVADATVNVELAGRHHDGLGRVADVAQQLRAGLSAVPFRMSVLAPPCRSNVTTPLNARLNVACWLQAVVGGHIHTMQYRTTGTPWLTLVLPRADSGTGH
jgi:hypothetical protein